MSLSPPNPARRGHLAFVVCTAAAIAIVAGVWVWTLRATVAQGVSGAKDVLADVAETAGGVKEQSGPNPTVVSAVKDGFQGMIDEQAAQAKQRQQTVDAVAGLMSKALDAASVPNEPDESVVTE